MNPDAIGPIVGGVLVPACIVLGAKRAIFDNLHANVALFAIAPLLAVGWLVQFHDSELRRHLSMAGFVVGYFATTYIAAWGFARADRRAKS